MKLKEIINTKLDNISPRQFPKNDKLSLASWGTKVLVAKKNEQGITVAMLEGGQVKESQNLFVWSTRPARVSMASSRPAQEAEQVGDFDKLYLDWLISLDSYLKQVHAAMLKRGDCFADPQNKHFTHCLPSLRATLTKMNEETGTERRLFDASPSAVAVALAGVEGCAWDSGNFETQFIGSSWGKR